MRLSTGGRAWQSSGNKSAPKWRREGQVAVRRAWGCASHRSLETCVSRERCDTHSNSPSWPSRSRGLVSVVTHTRARGAQPAAVRAGSGQGGGSCLGVGGVVTLGVVQLEPRGGQEAAVAKQRRTRRHLAGWERGAYFRHRTACTERVVTRPRRVRTRRALLVPHCLHRTCCHATYDKVCPCTGAVRSRTRCSAPRSVAS